jgi:oxalate decarboxylase/phosphoglucose isomerase-like protein (cupin superfamily)
MSNDIDTQRIYDEVKKCVLAACMKVPHDANPDFEEIKNRVQRRLAAMVSNGVVSNAKVISDTPAEALIREIMEEEEDSIKLEVTPIFPIKYIQCIFRIEPDS